MALNINPDATESAPGFPPQFTSTPVPSPMALFNFIPPAVHFNLHRVITEGIRHEQNTYGYFNSALACIFPPSQRFQINPQYPARPAVEVGGAHGRNVSVSSTGGVHAARGTGREDVTYPDFTLSKPLPRQPPTPRIHCNIGVIEIKTLSLPDERDVEKGKLSVEEALKQALGYARRLSNSPFSQREQNSTIIPTYVVYGTYYTRLVMIDTPAGPVWEADPWQYVFEEFALDEDRAPFLFRMCELAVRHWAYNG